MMDHLLSEPVSSAGDLLTRDLRLPLGGPLIGTAVPPLEAERPSLDARWARPAQALPTLAADWMDGVAVDDLRRRHGAALGTDDPMKFAAGLDRIIVHDLAWVLSAIVRLLEHEYREQHVGNLNAVAAMAKFGVATEPACYAASVGVRNREDAKSLSDLFPTIFGVNFPLFLAWVSTLTPDDVIAHVSPDTASLP